VLVYRSQMLPWSETFIRDQILALDNWRAILVGREDLDALPLHDISVELLPKDGFLSRVKSKLRGTEASFSPKAVEKLRSANPALLHAHFGPDGVDAWPLARALGLPMVVTLHGYDITIHRDWWEKGNGGRQMVHYPQQLLDLAKRNEVSFIAVSQAIRNRAIEYGIAGNKIAVKYIGVSPARFLPGDTLISKRPRRVVFVGRLVEKKGCQYLIQAMAEVQKQISDAEILIIGDGPLRHELENMASQLAVKVTFGGALPAAGVMQALNSSRLLCLPSVVAANGDAEGFGLVLLEAQACGIPVVTSALGGAAEGISEGVTGLSFRERDVEMLAKILVETLADNARLSEMARHCREFVSSKFDIAKCTHDLEAEYDRLSSHRAMQMEVA